jgi:hypothetical protein
MKLSYKESLFLLECTFRKFTVSIIGRDRRRFQERSVCMR